MHPWFIYRPDYGFLSFSCISCFSWFHSCISWFHSWFILSPPFLLFRAFRVFRGSTPVFRGSIRVHSCPFVVHTLSPPSFYFRAFRVFRGSIRGSIRVHSCPFVVHTLPPSFFFVYFVFFVVPHLYFVVPFVSIRGSYSPPPPFVFRVFRVFRGSTPVFRGSIRGSELWRRGLSSLPAVGFASSLSGYINRVWTETGGRSDYFGEESPDTTGQEARLKDRVSRGEPAVRIAQQRRDRRPFCVGKGEKGGVRAHRGSSQGLSARQAPSGARPNRKRGAARAMRKHSFGYRSR